MSAKPRLSSDSDFLAARVRNYRAAHHKRSNRHNRYDRYVCLDWQTPRHRCQVLADGGEATIGTLYFVEGTASAHNIWEVVGVRKPGSKGAKALPRDVDRAALGHTSMERIGVFRQRGGFCASLSRSFPAAEQVQKMLQSLVFKRFS